ncbi:MAG: double-strand break repair helicase AddA [Methyloceanibacter sp.]
MSSSPPPPLEADANQARASDPTASAWVSANAGTGKTEVLVRRVLRLLLTGARPAAILCLTYTKTAAAEMQHRLLAELSTWATMPTYTLRAKLAVIMRREPEEEHVRTARRLFARVLEAPGGLKIHTIHGFCERLLQRFPLESQVTPHFSVLDEREQSLMRSAAIDAVIGGAAAGSEDGLSKSLANIISHTTEGGFRKVIAAVLAKRAELTRLIAHHDDPADWAEAEARALKQVLNVAEMEEDALLAEVAGILSDADIDAAISGFVAHGGSTELDKSAEFSLRAARVSQGEGRVAALRELFLRADGNVRARSCSNTLQRGAPRTCQLLDEAKVRFAALEASLAHLRVAEASGALLTLADAIQVEYERRKRAEAMLDYDDLIVKTLHLLSRPGAAEWVLFKIEGGIEHILVDEAQDTNPDQWTIIERLAEEFFAGAGASQRVRTLFAVGDEKQSIYSFQGANPARFGEMARKFDAKAAAIGQPFHNVPLTLSFRSVPPILNAVDLVFAQSQAAQGLAFVESAVIKHEANRAGEPGLVEIWEAEKEEKPAPVEAFEPWRDEAAGARSVDELCRRIAAQLKHWIASAEIYLPSQKRHLRAGDVLILVRRRDPFIGPMIRALKHEGVAVAGADRMRLMEQLAVGDLVALADVLLMPEDDLALAVTLKSPLFGLDDDALFALAHERAGSLWSELKSKSKDNARFREARERLTAWLGRADRLPPYEFFSELLGSDGQLMRKRLLSRLGPEAAEAIDEFLDLALVYDRDAAPSLQGFVDRVRVGDVEIKRDMEQERDEVRIMTVHGAKGLQAPVVFLPDTCMEPRAQWPRLFSLPRPGSPPNSAEHLVWPPTGHSGIAGLAAAKTAADQADREEYHRLLYVAMTRAQDRLYVCGWQGQRDGPGKGSWYELIRTGLQGRLTPGEGYGGRPVHRLESVGAASEPAPKDPQRPPPPAPLPDWALRPAPPERMRLRFAPSRLSPHVEGPPAKLAEQAPLGPRALSKDSRYARGRLMHALLQHLPEVRPENQEPAARAFVSTRGAGLPDQLKEEIVSETLAIVRDARFAPLFQPGSLSEVPVVARIDEGKAGFDLEGQIDRLAILEEDLLILDYKTNRPPPQSPEDVAQNYVDQLAAYRLALGRLFPGRAVRAALMWTDGPRLMEIPSTSLDEAERGILQRMAQP